MDSFADIEGPVRIGFYWLLILSILGGGLLVALIAFLVSRRHRNGHSESAPIPLRSPMEIALERIGRLRSDGDSLEAEPYTVEVSDIVRDYIESALRLPAREQTSEEFLFSLRRRQDLPEALPRHMPGFLEQCDHVKFARQGLGREQREGLLQTAEIVVESTESSLATVREQPESNGSVS